MIFKTDEEAINIIKANKNVPAWVLKAREYSRELCALVDGEDFQTS